MISFLMRKMWKNKWMMLSLLIGNILLIGIVSSAPLYSEAVMQRILIKDMQQTQLDNNIHPATSEFRYNFYNAAPEKSVSSYIKTRDEILPDVIDDLDIPILNVVQNLSFESLSCIPAVQREEAPRKRMIGLQSFEGQTGHLRLLQGRLPSDSIADGNVIECIAGETAMSRNDFLLDELMTVTLNVMWDPENSVTRHNFYLKVVGIYEALDEPELYWTKNPNTFTNNLLVSDRLINDRFIEEYDPDFTISSNWIIMLDYSGMRAEKVSGYQATDERIKDEFNTPDRVWYYSENFISTLEGYSQRAAKLSLTLLVLQVPIFVLMAFYIFTVSRQMLRLEQNDISVLKSRGAGRWQIFNIYLLQSLFIGVLSIFAGLLLGIAVCRVLGAANGFLDLASRSALKVIVGRNAFVYSCVAAVASMMMMLAPVVRFSRVTIVDYKRSKFGGSGKPLWQRFFLDILCFGLSIYALLSFNSQREVIARAVTGVRSVDPVLFMSSSLFIIGMGLICLRLLPLLIRLLYIAGKRFWPPAPYVSLLRTIRSGGDEQFVIIFLIFTLAVGIFSAKAARTINRNDEDQIMYQAGADLVFAEGWSDNRPTLGMGEQLPAGFQLVYTVPDIERFSNFEEVDAYTQVQVGTIGIQRQQNRAVSNGVTLMAVDTQTFGETLWFRGDLLPVHVNYFLNALSSQDNAVLLSSNFKTKLGYKVGQTVICSTGEGDYFEGWVCGFIDYWPRFSTVVEAEDRTGERVQIDAFLVVANLGYVQSMWGVRPYQIWMSTNSPTNSFIYDYIEDNNLRVTFFNDAKATLAESKHDPILQGINGVLTVGFIVSLVVCFTGFLIFWILSIKSRTLQFGVFRAMGMTMRNIVGILISEQILTTLTAVGIGAVVGEVSSRLFVPLIQLSYNASEQVIPLLLFAERRDYAGLFGIIGLMIVVCLAILGVIVSKLKITQALKLGED